MWIPAAVLFIILLLLYGPFDGFRLMWINTAMYTSRHKFLARMLYSKRYIQSVLSLNEPAAHRTTDDSELANNWNDEIIYAEIRGNHFRGFIIKINDPRRLAFVQSDLPAGYLLEDLVGKYGGTGGINASGYADPRQRGGAWGITIANNQVISRITRGNRHVMGGFNGDYKLVIGNFSEEEILVQDYQWAFEFGPLLIVNGEKTELTSFSGGLAPRSAIGQTAEGHVLLVAIDGRQVSSIGATFQDVQNVLFANGAVNAINLDGGSSTTIMYQGAVVNSPADGDAERLLPNAIVFN